MQYKTIVLQLLRDQYPALHGRLKQARTLLSALDLYSARLKVSHTVWKHSLAERTPGSDPSQITAEALEFALQEFQDLLQADTAGEAATTYHQAQDQH